MLSRNVGTNQPVTRRQNPEGRAVSVTHILYCNWLIWSVDVVSQPVIKFWSTRWILVTATLQLLLIFKSNICVGNETER